MVKTRLIWLALLSAVLSLIATGGNEIQETPPTLETPAPDDVDFRACDRDWNTPNP